MVDQLNAFAAEVTRVAREVGTEGKLGGQAQVPGVAGTWKDLTDSVNSMAEQPDRAGAQHRRGGDRGGARRPVAQDHRRRQGEILELKDTINTMVDQLNAFAARGDARGARGRHRRASSAARRRCPASPARGRT